MNNNANIKYINQVPFCCEENYIWSGTEIMGKCWLVKFIKK